MNEIMKKTTNTTKNTQLSTIVSYKLQNSNY